MARIRLYGTQFQSVFKGWYIKKIILNHMLPYVTKLVLTKILWFENKKNIPLYKIHMIKMNWSPWVFPSKSFGLSCMQCYSSVLLTVAVVTPPFCPYRFNCSPGSRKICLIWPRSFNKSTVKVTKEKQLLFRFFVSVYTLMEMVLNIIERIYL